MNETIVSQMHDQIHDIVKDLLLIGHFVNLTKRIARNKLHDNCVSIEVDRFGNWKTVVVQSLNRSIFILNETSYVISLP